MARIARLPHFAGVILACGCLIGMLGFGPRSGMGFLLTPMSSAHSWGREVFALALAIQMLLWGVVVCPNVRPCHPLSSRDHGRPSQ